LANSSAEPDSSKAVSAKAHISSLIFIKSSDCASMEAMTAALLSAFCPKQMPQT